MPASRATSRKLQPRETALSTELTKRRINDRTACFFFLFCSNSHHIQLTVTMQSLYAIFIGKSASLKLRANGDFIRDCTAKVNLKDNKR